MSDDGNVYYGQDWPNPEVPPPWDEEPPDRRASPYQALSGTQGAHLGLILPRSGLAKLPPVEPLVGGLLSRPSAAVIVGSYGVGKTAFTIGLSGSLGTSRPWLGREVAGCRVLFVVGEGASGIDDKVTAWELTWNEGEAVPDDMLTFSIKPGSLAKPATWQTLTSYAVDGGYGAVFLDTFSSLAPDADEVKDAPMVMRHLSDLSAAIEGTAVLVHHPGWSDNSRTRGGYQFEANADEVIVLKGDPVNSLVELERKKVKNGQSGARLWLRRAVRNGSVVFEEGTAGDALVPVRERIVAVLLDYREAGASATQLALALGITGDRSSLYRALRSLKTDGQVVEVGRRGRGRYFLAKHAPEEAR